MSRHLLYEELTPSEFKERLDACPVGYLPLGTIEWHGPHNPLGVDLLESRDLFLLAAEKTGGIVFPPVFLGPDRRVEKDGVEYLGMDVYLDSFTCPSYPLTVCPGSCYWVPDDVYKTIIESIARQAARAGFRVLMGVGHGPSTDLFAGMAEEIKEKYGIVLLTPYMGNPEKRYITDHAAMSETSNTMYFHPDLVHMEYLSDDPEEFPIGVAGKDPRIYASPKHTEALLPTVLAHIDRLIKEALNQD